MKIFRFWLLLLLTCSLAASASEPPPVESTAITQRVEAILEQTAAQKAYWGIKIYDLENRTTVYERNSGRLFLPASNVKLFSSALALQRLGSDYRFSTSVAADGEIDENGVLQGDLLLVGGGDPNFSARLHPYHQDRQFGPDLMQPVKLLARRIQEAGIRQVNGDLVGDDTRYVWQTYPSGWSYADTLQQYGSPTSALVFNDNLIQLNITPGTARRPAHLMTKPDLAYYTIQNHTITLPGQWIYRQLATRLSANREELIISGEIRQNSRGRVVRVAPDDPALYATLALKKALAEVGIEISGETRTIHQRPESLLSLQSLPQKPPRGGNVLVELSSEPLRAAITVLNKESENLHAEMLLREVALQEANIGSQEAALISLKRFLSDAGLRSEEFFLVDGSGLSRQNLLSPNATIQLLQYMWNSASRDDYINSLPVAGRDGTLDWRFTRSPARGLIRAKTGSMTHVVALSGYASRPSGKTYAFSIFANNFGISSTSTRESMDRIAEALVRP